MSKEALALVRQAKENPYRFFSVAEIGELFGFGRNTMTSLINSGAPLVARKMNPDVFKEWLKRNAKKLREIAE